MLNTAQIEYLAGLSGCRIIKINQEPVSIVRPDKNRKIVVPYENFKNNMGLEDLDWQVLCGQYNMIGGGAALNWVWQEEKNEDIDFFFLNNEGKRVFASFISAPSFGFHCSRETGYADTYFNAERNITFQLVSLHYGTPFEILAHFDFGVCKWIVDADNLYTYAHTISDLLAMRLSDTNNKTGIKGSFVARVLKYYRKGFYLDSGISEKLGV